MSGIVERTGLANALIEKGKVVWQNTYDFANVEHQQALNANTVMYAASLTTLMLKV